MVNSKRLGKRVQTFGALVFIRLIILLMHSSIFGALIWETLGSDRNVNFSKLNTVVISATLPEEKAFFQTELKKVINDRATLVVFDDAMKNLSTILDAQLMVHFVYTTTDHPSISLFQVYATTQVEIIASQKTQTGVIWDKNYLIEDRNQKKDLNLVIKKSLNLFIDQYFSTREKHHQKPTFYFFFNP